ncbi:MAG: hypothetical protein ACFFCD_17975 [Promethearchaeota archaeon]
MADFACNFYFGYDAQESLIRYIDVKAFPKISGFILIPDEDVPLEDLKYYLYDHTGEEFEKNNSVFVNLTEENNTLYGKIKYTLSEYHSHNMFNTEQKEISFSISKEKNIFVTKLIQKRDSDYSVFYEVMHGIIQQDKRISLKILENDLSKLPTTPKRHEFFKKMVEEVSKKDQLIGATKFGRNKAQDLGTSDSFEERYRKGSQDIEITSVEVLTKNLEERGAYLDELDLVLYNMKNKRLFILKILCRENKKRIEIGLSSDIKKIDKSEQLTSIKSRDDINKLNSMNLNDDDKLNLIMDMWNTIAREFYIFWDKVIEDSKDD